MSLVIAIHFHLFGSYLVRHEVVAFVWVDGTLTNFFELHDHLCRIKLLYFNKKMPFFYNHARIDLLTYMLDTNVIWNYQLTTIFYAMVTRSHHGSRHLPLCANLPKGSGCWI